MTIVLVHVDNENGRFPRYFNAATLAGVLTEKELICDGTNAQWTTDESGSRIEFVDGAVWDVVESPAGIVNQIPSDRVKMIRKPDGKLSK
jgi:hypothetical protein